MSVHSAENTAKPRGDGLHYAIMAAILFSTSPVLVRFAAPLSPFEITFGRMFCAAAAVAILARATGVPVRIARAEARKFGLYGLITALHFLLYAASLSMTTIAHSLALVYTSPVFVTLFSALLLGERISQRKWLCIPIVVIGVAIMTGFEPQMTLTMAVGNLMAIGSAVCFGLYSVAGRHERKTYPLLKYALGVYAGAALWLLPAAAFTASGAYFGRALGAVVALGVFPLGIGHTLYNAGLRRIHPTYVNLIATQEVTGGVLLGFLLLGEAPGPTTLIGAALSLIGVILIMLLE